MPYLLIKEEGHSPQTSKNSPEKSFRTERWTNKVDFWSAELTATNVDVIWMFYQKLGCMGAISIDQGGGTFLPNIKKLAQRGSLEQNGEWWRWISGQQSQWNAEEIYSQHYTKSWHEWVPWSQLRRWTCSPQNEKTRPEGNVSAITMAELEGFLASKVDRK